MEPTDLLAGVKGYIDYSYPGNGFKINARTDSFIDSHVVTVKADPIYVQLTLDVGYSDDERIAATLALAIGELQSNAIRAYGLDERMDRMMKEAEDAATTKAKAEFMQKIAELKRQSLSGTTYADGALAILARLEAEI